MLDPATGAGQGWSEISGAPSASPARFNTSAMPGASTPAPGRPGAGGPGAGGRGAARPDRDAPAAAFSGSGPGGGQDAVVRRTADGWRVGDDDLPDLTCAMVLADLIAAELPTEIQPAITDVPPPEAQPGSVRAGHTADRRPAPKRGRERQAEERPDDEDETLRLRTTVGQLEHALTARIRVEQAIGVLAERHRIHPRQAFEQLRSAARNRGKRVIDIAADVVASASNPLLQLPEELSRQRSAPRHGGRHSRRALRPE